MKNLTEKQRRFVEAYTGPAKGNATAAARMAGYSGDDRALAVRGAETVRNRKVVDAIAALTASLRQAAIMTAEERQTWLTRVVQGEVPDVVMVDGVPMEAPARLKERLTASEQLSKMQGSYIEKREVKHDGAQVTFYVPDNGRDGSA